MSGTIGNSCVLSDDVNQKFVRGSPNHVTIVDQSAPDISSLRGKGAQLPVIDNKNAVRSTVTWNTNWKTAALHVSFVSQLLSVYSSHHYRCFRQCLQCCHLGVFCLFAGIWRSFAHNSVPCLCNTSALNTVPSHAFIGIFWINVAVAPSKNEKEHLTTARIFTVPSMMNQVVFAQMETSKWFLAHVVYVGSNFGGNYSILEKHCVLHLFSPESV